jgi:hypothetical protein
MKNSFIFAALFLFNNIAMAEISNLSTNNISTAEIKRVSSIQEKAQTNLDEENPLAGGFNDLIPYIMPTPYQENAGSCLYMSHTGIVEWWMNKLNNLHGEERLDLSERYFMALKTERTGQENIENWRTDNIYRLNKSGVIYKNEDYRYTKGYYKKVDGVRVATTEADEKAKYGTRFNWITYRTDLDPAKAIKAPKFKRNVLLVDKDKNQWNVGEAPLNIADQVKEALVKNNAPVLVIYNHQGFWHANIVFGFNDNTKHECPFVSSFKPYMDERAVELRKEADETTSAKKKKSLLAKAKKFVERGDKVQKRYEEIGGCSGKGAFYVRDSIFPNENMPVYDYDLNKEGEEKHLNSTLILREYEWLTTSANHIIQILPANE